MSLVQSIVVKPSTHFDTVAACAIASGLALVTADLTQGSWAAWLSSSFTKSVRRAKRDADLHRARLLGLPGAEITVGEATAISFAPLSYAEMPREIIRLQVSGLDAVRDTMDFYRPAAVTPRIEVNSEVTMSTGKTAAQVAHALCAWLLAQTNTTRAVWASEPGLSISEVDFADRIDDPADPEIMTIRDNGLTEIAPGTETVRTYLGSHA